MAEPAPPVPAKSTPPKPADKSPQPDAGTPATSGFGIVGDKFIAKLGAGLRLPLADIKSKDGMELSTLRQPLPGVKLTKAKWVEKKKRLELEAKLAVPHLDEAAIKINVNDEGKPSFDVKLKKKLKLAALGDPDVALTLSEEGEFGGSVIIEPKDLTPKGLKSLTVTGGGTLTIRGGLFTGNVDATLAYANLGNGEVHFAVSEAGRISATGMLRVTPPFLNEATANLTLAEDGNLNGTVTVSLTEAKSPIPALSLTAGTLSVSYVNGAVSGSISEFHAAYRGLADVTASASIEKGVFAGEGDLKLTVPGLKEASGKIKVNKGVVSGSMTLAASAFPEALPVKSGTITATLAENGRISFKGSVGIELGPVGSGQLTGAYSETGELSISATMNLTVPGLQGAQVSVAYVNGDISGEAQVPIDPSLIPGLTGNATVRYQQGLWSGETELAYSADDGKLSGRITITVAQTEAGTLQLGGTGEVEAQIAPRLRGMLTATILPEGGVDVSGTITVTEPLELFPEKTFDKELFKYSQNIPLWAILVAVIRVRAGIRGGIGAGVFRNIVVEGSYTIGSAEADPTFSISGEMFIPAYVEAYVAFGAGLGLDVVLGSLTGGIEGVATAGIYGAISVVPELSYADGDWSIEGTATLAAGARLKIGLNAWAEVEALWVTVWEESWKLGEWVWNVGPDLGLQAHMAYRFGQPGPPEIEFNSSDIDTESMIQAAMPEDGPAPSGAKEALDNKAEWKGKLKEQKPAPLPPDLAAQSQAAPPAPPQPAQQPKPKSGPPSGGAGGPAEGGEPGAAPGTPAGAQAAADTAATDSSVKGAVPASEVPNADQPRYPAPVTLATLDEPPAPLPRTKDQELEDVKAAEKALELAMDASKDSEVLESYFPRIKARFRLAQLGYVGDLERGVDIEGGVNPQIKVDPTQNVTAKGAGIAAPGRTKPWQTKILHESGVIGSTVVGIAMTASPLGPDHEIGSSAGGQDDLFLDLPTNPATDSHLDLFIKGHLLNAELGGPGVDYNQFPITSKANSQHHAKVEKHVKEVVNDRRLWVVYTVKVTGTDKLVDLKGPKKNPATGKPYKAIDSWLDCEAYEVTLAGNKRSAPFVRERISSKYEPKLYASGQATDISEPAAITQKPADLSGIPAQSSVQKDLDFDVQLVSEKDPAVFPETMRDQLAGALWDKKGRKKVRELIGAVHYIGTGERLDILFEAYDEANKHAPNSNGYDISALGSKKLVQFAVVKGLWKEVWKKIK